MAFITEYHNHTRAAQKEESQNIDTEQARQAAAYDAAFCVVLKYTRDHVLEQNEVLHLSFL